MSDCIKQIGLVVARLEISKMWKQSGPDDGKTLLDHIKNLGRTSRKKNFKPSLSQGKNICRFPNKIMCY